MTKETKKKTNNNNRITAEQSERVEKNSKAIHRRTLTYTCDNIKIKWVYHSIDRSNEKQNKTKQQQKPMKIKTIIWNIDTHICHSHTHRKRDKHTHTYKHTWIHAYEQLTKREKKFCCWTI